MVIILKEYLIYQSTGMRNSYIRTLLDSETRVADETGGNSELDRGTVLVSQLDETPEQSLCFESYPTYLWSTL